MKTRSATFDLEWADPVRRVGVYSVKFARRKWNGSAYVLEDQVTLDNNVDIVEIGPITQNLDTPIASQFLNSNMTLRLNNKGWQWLPANTTNGEWKSASTIPYGSQFQIYYGFSNDSGDESLAIFTGYVDDLIFDSVSGVVQVSLAGREALLQNSDATKVCLALTAQVTTPAVGDGVVLEFDTGKASVWRISAVYVDGVLKTQGTDEDYTLSNINDAETNALITFNAGKAPSGGAVVTWEGNQWYINQSIGVLAGLVCDVAGVASADRTIDEPVFPGGGASSSITIDTEAQFEAGTLQNIDTTSAPGSILKKWLTIDDFADLELTADPSWTIQRNVGSVSAATGSLVLTSTLTGGIAPDTTIISTPFTGTTGTWRFSLDASANSGATESVVAFFMLTDATPHVGSFPSGFPIGNGYYIQVFDTATYLYAYSNGTSTIIATAAGDYRASGEWRISRSALGAFEVFKDNVSIMSVTDTTYISSNVIALGVTGTSSLHGSATFGGIYFSNALDGLSAFSASDAIFVSAAQDALTTPSSWGAIVATQVLNGGTILYETSSSADDISYEAYVAVSASNVIQSTLNRYFKIRATITPADGSLTSPVISKIVANFATLNLFIASADFSGLTCADAMNTLAIAGGMEWGTDGEGHLFFRSKSVASGYDIDLDERGAISEVTSYSLGYEDVKNVGQVPYNGYISQSDADSESEASPTSEETYGRRVLSLSLGNFLFSNSAQVADSIALGLYTNNRRAKLKLTVLCRITPQVDLGDRARISFYDGDLLRANIYGDKAQKGFPASSSPMNVLARNLIMKIVGATHSVMAGTSQLKLEVIL